jgi:hypothetical protein
VKRRNFLQTIVAFIAAPFALSKSKTSERELIFVAGLDGVRGFLPIAKFEDGRLVNSYLFHRKI